MLAIADALEARTEEILAANAVDLESGREAGLTDALLDRLMLDDERIAAIAAQVRDIAALPDPVGEVIDGFRRPNGLDVTKVRTPIGVVAIVYEARPNVTIDAAALCLKSGNACVLRGSSSAEHSNRVLASIAADHAPSGAIQLMVGNIAAAAPFVGNGRLRALAVTSVVRSPLLPDVPTVAESGLPGFENTGWFGFMVPAGTPRAIVERIHRDTVKVLQTTQMKARLFVQGMTPVGNQPAEFAAAIDKESAYWAKVIERRGLKAN